MTSNNRKPPRKATNMSEEEVEALKHRLEMAERVCLLYGWSPTTHNEDAEIVKATLQAWCEWGDVVPPKFLEPRSHPELNSQATAELAAKRDRIRAETLGWIDKVTS